MTIEYRGLLGKLGGDVANIVLKLIPLTAALVLAGCIPPGKGDYRIKGADAPPEERPTAAAPQIVPERDVIAATPTWNPAQVERNGRLVEASLYTVQPGDTLYKIEANTGAGLRQIATENALSAPYALRAGQQLTIPAGFYHRVASGETGIAIARAYAVPWAEIVTLNALDAPYVLRAGQRLRLPDSASAVPVSGAFSPEQRASTFSLNIDDVVTGSEPAVAAAVGVPASNLSSAIARPAAFAGGFGWPVNGKLVSRFGSQGGGRINDGINIAAAKGTPVGSSAAGVVVYSGNEIGVFGGLVLVDHGGGWVTAYGHLGRLDVARGDKVAAGQALGAVGDTGYVTQSQLHFEIRKDRKPVDPATKLAAR